MKRLIILLFFLISIGVNAQPFTNITAGESGLSVRTNLNNMINYMNALGLQLQFSSDQTNWHYPFAVGDRYIRYSGTFGVTWSSAFGLSQDVTQYLTGNYIPVFDGTTFANSPFYQDVDRIGLGTTSPGTQLDIDGNLRIRQPGSGYYQYILGLDSLGYVTTNIVTSLIPDSSWVAITVTDTLNILGQNIRTISTGATQNTALVTKGYVDEAITLGGGYTDADARAAIGAILDNGTLGDIIFTYTGGTPSIHGDVKDNSHSHTISNVTALQDSLTAKQKVITGAATTVTSADLTASRAMVTTSGGKITTSAATATEVGYLSGVTSNIQTQINSMGGVSKWTERGAGIDYSRGTRKGNVGIGESALLDYNLWIARDSIKYVAGFYNRNNTATAHGVEIISTHTSSNILQLRGYVLGALTDLFRFKGDGRLNLTRYTGTIMDGAIVKLLGVDASGVVYTAPIFTVQSLSGTTVAWNATSGYNATITLSGNTTITLSNLVAGTNGNLTVTNAATAHTLTFAGYTFKISPSVYRAANSPTTSGSSLHDVFSWYYDGATVFINGTNGYQ